MFLGSLKRLPRRLCLQRVGVQPRRTTVRVGHQVGRTRPGRNMGGIVETTAVFQENVGQERSEHPDYEDRQGTGLLAVRVQQQQLAVAAQMTGENSTFAIIY